MTSPVAPLIDFIMELFRSPNTAQAFVANPDQTLRDAGLPNVNAAQLQAVAATAAPAGVVMGGGDPIVGLQRAVADHHSIASPFSPQTSFASQPTFAPETNAEFASRNVADVASPDAVAGGAVQQGGFNLGFGDITLGDKTTATEGSVIGSGSATTAGGDVIKDVDGPVIKDVDMSGGDGGGATAGGGVIIDPAQPVPAGGGKAEGGEAEGGEAEGGDGGDGGDIIINPIPQPATEPVPEPDPVPAPAAEDAAADQAAQEAAALAEANAQFQAQMDAARQGLPFGL